MIVYVKSFEPFKAAFVEHCCQIVVLNAKQLFVQILTDVIRLFLK